MQNERFWQQLGELGKKGKYDDDNIRKLLAEHGLKVSEAKPLAMTKEGSVFLSSQSTYTMSAKAMKDVEKLQGHLRQKFNQFLSDLGHDGNASLQNIRSQPGKWAMHKLEGTTDHYSVRLNHGYRVAFRLNDGVLDIYDVTKTFTHNN